MRDRQHKGLLPENICRIPSLRPILYSDKYRLASAFPLGVSTSRISAESRRLSSLNFSNRPSASYCESEEHGQPADTAHQRKKCVSLNRTRSRALLIFNVFPSLVAMAVCQGSVLHLSTRMEQ